MDIDIAPAATSAELATDTELRDWLQANAGSSATLPWEADPQHMATLDAPLLPIQFGAQTDPAFALVEDWVAVDELCGMATLYCGSYGGKFYLRTTPPPTTAPATIAPAQEGEDIGMLPVYLAGESPPQGTPLPRQACPISLRNAMLQVGGQWRSDLYWDTLINGQTCHQPPESSLSADWTCPLRHYTLRLVQVGRWLVFHSRLSTPEVSVQTANDTQGNPYIVSWSVEPSRYRDIGYSSWYGGTLFEYGNWYYWGLPDCHDASAEPPWGKDLAESYAGTLDPIAPAPTPYDDATPYCRVYPRAHAGPSWGRHAGGNLGGDVAPATIDSGLKTALSNYLIGISPEWCEERLGLSDSYTRSGASWTTTGIPDVSLYRNITPSATWALVFDAHLPHPDGRGHIYCALYTATIDASLLTASIFYPYAYRTPS